jgi:hypothetical protein
MVERPPFLCAGFIAVGRAQLERLLRAWANLVKIPFLADNENLLFYIFKHLEGVHATEVLGDIRPIIVGTNALRRCKSFRRRASTSHATALKAIFFAKVLIAPWIGLV